jgi:hypothetical protein
MACRVVAGVSATAAGRLVIPSSPCDFQSTVGERNVLPRLSIPCESDTAESRSRPRLRERPSRRIRRVPRFAAGLPGAPSGGPMRFGPPGRPCRERRSCSSSVTLYRFTRFTRLTEIDVLSSNVSKASKVSKASNVSKVPSIARSVGFHIFLSLPSLRTLGPPIRPTAGTRTAYSCRTAWQSL